MFASVTTPALVEDQRASALRFDDPRVQALLSALVLFRLLPHGFANRDCAPCWRNCSASTRAP